MLNPAFGYLNSQVLDKDAFRAHLGAPAGEETQRELQEASQNNMDQEDPRRGGIQHVKLESVDAKCMAVKIEKENIALGDTYFSASQRYTELTRIQSLPLSLSLCPPHPHDFPRKNERASSITP